MTHADLKVGDKVFHRIHLPGEEPRLVRSKVWHKRYSRKTGELWAIDLTFPRGLIKEIPLEHIVLLSAVERLGDLA
jgi:hypothetical protein